MKSHQAISVRRALVQDDTHYWVMRRLQETPDISQRQLAKELGISLGSVNYCLQALVDKGWIKMQNFSTEKAGLTRRFLKRKMEEYELLKTEIESLKAEVPEERRTGL